MSNIKLIISDLHLADGHPVLDGFGEAQQSALEGLLHATSPDGPLGRAAEDIELIINGDCFDFLVIQPFALDGTTSPVAALEKLEKVIAAHLPFFELLRKFMHTPERHVTFITGNHDIELCFEEVRTRIAEAIYGKPGYRASRSGEMQGELNFYTSRFYRPLPDVYIEHGNHYDFWNYISDIWDDEGRLLTLNPSTIRLPIGSQYILHAGYPISMAHPYFDHFEPSMNIMRQFALLSLLHPDLVIETAQRVMGMLSYPRKALADLAPGENLFQPGSLNTRCSTWSPFNRMQRRIHPRGSLLKQLHEVIRQRLRKRRRWRNSWHYVMHSRYHLLRLLQQYAPRWFTTWERMLREACSMS